MKKYELSIGLNDAKSKVQEIVMEDAVKIISLICFEKAGGVTIIPNCTGIYRHEDGTKIIETTIRCEFYDAPREIVIEIAKILCKELNQESIAFSESIIDGDFISA